MTKIKEMNIKKISVNIDTTYKYLQIWNGIFNLTLTFNNFNELES